MKMWIFFFFLNKHKWLKYCPVHFRTLVLLFCAVESDSVVLTYYYCCLLVWDVEINDGSPDRPFYMDKTLQKLFNKKNTVK